MRDQDSCNCLEIKQNLVEKCERTKRRFLVRILCHELENWYLADLRAIEQAYDLMNISNKQNSSKFRDPDKLSNAKQVLRSIVSQYQPISGSREISKYLNPYNTRSKSFLVFIQGYKKILTELFN